MQRNFNPHYPLPTYFLKDGKNIVRTQINGVWFFIQGESELLDINNQNMVSSDNLILACKHSIAPLLDSTVLGVNSLSADYFILNYGGGIIARLFETSCGLVASEGGYKVE